MCIRDSLTAEALVSSAVAYPSVMDNPPLLVVISSLTHIISCMYDVFLLFVALGNASLFTFDTAVVFSYTEISKCYIVGVLYATVNCNVNRSGFIY